MLAKLCKWLSSLIQQNIPFQSMDDMWNIYSKPKSQHSLIIKYIVIHLINGIWVARNTSRFQDKIMTFGSICSLIFVQVNCSSSNTNLAYKCGLGAFSTIKEFKVPIHPTRAPRIKEVIWTPSSLNWIKCNIDGACT